MVASLSLLNTDLGHSSYFKMMSSPSHGTQTSQTRVSFSKEILVRGDLTEDVNDIVEKFIKVAHGPEALENNRARENARENIRKKLAMEAGREKQDSCDLQICFVNEFASDEESPEDHDEMAALAREDIVMSNISKRVSQIIVPLAAVNRQGENSKVPGNGSVEAESDFLAKVSLLQAEAKEDLVSARENARIKLQDIINTRKKLRNRNLFNLLGLPLDTKLNRRTVSKLNVAQLQLIQNDYLSQIQGLNEELVSLLVRKDDLTMEQDALMTDIEDLSQFVNTRK